MAGYLFTLDSTDALRSCAESGTYATRIAPPRGYWGIPAEGTIADFATMRPGDHVYFFIKRKIYGIGELVRVGHDCKYDNYPNASEPRTPPYEDVADRMLLDTEPEGVNQRWVCFFRPSPHFFTRGVDMDDVLSSNPSSFRMLRAIWKLSFIKFDDEENQAFRDVLLRANLDALAAPSAGSVFPDRHQATHERAQARVGREHRLGVASVVAAAAEGSKLKHEMALEAGLLQQLADSDEGTTRVLGKWDYLSHQVIASPFKPIDYMDKMDIFGYAFIEGFRPTRERYLVCELKADKAREEDVDQLLKYVDWVKDEYSLGDYSTIQAKLVAHDFEAGLSQYVWEYARRYYTVGRRPAETRRWGDLRLVRYSYRPDDGRIDLEEMRGPTVREASLTLL